MIKLLVAILGAMPVMQGMPSGVALTGSVRTLKGQPIANALIYSRSENQVMPRKGSDNDKPFWAITDLTGSFRITEYGKVLFFLHPGFRPLVRLLNESTRRVDVVLEEEPESTTWSIPVCIGINMDRVGGQLQLPLPKWAKVEQFIGTDYSGARITQAHGVGQDELIVFWGPTAASGFPAEKYVLTATDLETRTYKSGYLRGVDMRGHSADGKYWRLVGSTTDQISYYDASLSSAQAFDDAISHTCRMP